MTATILVVDDDAAFRKLLAQQLSAKGYQILTAADGEEALEKLASHQPDLVLLDVERPWRNGFEVCQLLKQQPDARLTPVVLVTGLRAREDRIRGIHAGADDFLSKPVDRNELFARVHSLVSLKAYTDELERAESVVLARRNPGARPGAYVMLAARDTGRGVDSEAVSRVFEPFYISGQKGAAGLGLAAVYGIVKQSGGYIGAESQPGAGTACTIDLPRAEEVVEETA